MQTVTYTIPNISCQHCVRTIKREVGDMRGVWNVEGDVQTKQVTISFEAPASEEAIQSLLAEINYPVGE